MHLLGGHGSHCFVAASSGREDANPLVAGRHTTAGLAVKGDDVIHEMRVYRTLPGQMPRLLERFRRHTTVIWSRLGIRPVGFWITAVGEVEGSELTYLLAWDSFADRETRWSAFQADAEWRQVKAESEKEGALVANVRNQLLVPTDFSAIR